MNGKISVDCDHEGPAPGHRAIFVEIALTLPVMVALLLGAAEFASVAYVAIEVSNAAKAAVAYGAQSPTTVSDTTGIQNATMLNVSNITLTSSNVTVSTAGVC